MTITIINTDGMESHTTRVKFENAEQHIKACDQLADEAAILLAYIADYTLADRSPIAWKYADPTEDGRFVFDESEVAEIARQDPGLIERIEVQWAEVV